MGHRPRPTSPRRKGRPPTRDPALTASAVDQLVEEAWAIHADDPRRALELAAAAQQAAAARSDQPGLARSRHLLGLCHLQLGAYEVARGELLAAFQHYDALDAQEPQASVLNTLGNLHSALGDHHTAYTFYLRALGLRQHLGLAGAEAASWNNIGNVFFHLGDYAQALTAHQRSLALKESLGDQAGAAISLNNIGNVAKASGDLAGALRYYQQSLAIAQALGKPYNQAGALGNLGSIYTDLGQPQLALDHHLQSLAIEQAIGNRHGEAESLLQLGKLYLLFPDLPAAADPAEPAGDPALRYLQRSLALAEPLGLREITMHAAELLAQLYEQRGDFSQALAAYRQFHDLERALFNETLSEKTRNLQIIHQVETAMREADLQRVEAELAHLRNTELQALLAETERQRAIAQEASQFKTKLLAMAAHDLKNPLSGISGFADLLLLMLPPNPQLHGLAERIRLSSRRMEHMLNDLLDSTRIESGELCLRIVAVDWAQLAQEVIESYRQLAQRKGQVIQLHADQPYLVQADRAALWRVLENLLSNAMKFSPFERRIWVEFSRHGSAVRCAVRDEGPGLTEQDQRLLFSRFERLSAQPTAGENSTGLGLSIVRQLVELQGGRAWAESAGQGRGSTFFVELPAAATAHPHPRGSG